MNVAAAAVATETTKTRWELTEAEKLEGRMLAEGYVHAMVMNSFYRTEETATNQIRAEFQLDQYENKLKGTDLIPSAVISYLDTAVADATTAARSKGYRF